MSTDFISSTVSGDQARLLRYLKRDGAFALVNIDQPETLDLFRSVAGVTMGGGSVSRDAACKPCASGALKWIADGQKQKLIHAGHDLAAAQHITPALRQSAIVVEERPDATGHAQIVLVNRAESPLAWLHSRKDRQGRPLLDASSFAAGERLRQDMEAARMMPRISANWSASSASNARGPTTLLESERALAARQRVDLALVAVGAEFSGLMIDVCGFLKGLPQVEMERDWPPRSARIVLNLALAKLAQHYEGGAAKRLRSDHDKRKKPSRLNWHSEDAKPELTW